MADRSPYGLVLSKIDESLLPSSVFGDTNRWETLAQSLAANLQRACSAPTTVVVRPDSSPHLGVLGRATPNERESLETLVDLFLGGLSRLRYVDYAQAEDDCLVLAEKLQKRLGREGLEEAVFTGIPRGGSIVLGLLSYALDLSHEQLSPQGAPSAPLVVVDDCFISGCRAARFLNEKVSRSTVTLAGLYAPPDLRTALKRDRPSVRACVTARDLKDHAPRLYGDDYAEWKARCEARADGPRHWIGVPDHLCFPWSEPDVGFWTAATDSVTQAWPIVPASRCLDRRSGASPSPSLVSVQRPPSGRSDGRAVHPGPSVFYAKVGSETILLNDTTKTCVVLNDTAEDFWWALLEHETIDEARQALLKRYDVDSEMLEDDLQTFVDTAVDRHLLTSGRAAPRSL